MDNILTINAGSSSLKCALYHTEQDQLLLLYNIQVHHLLETPEIEIKDLHGELCHQADLRLSSNLDLRHEEALAYIFNWLREHAPDDLITCFSHRVVHGGPHYHHPVVITAKVLTELTQLEPLAPLHQPYNLKLIQACQQRLPQVPNIACFDTMFHCTQPALATEFALPRKMTAAGIRRYGFHGLSYEYIETQLETLGILNHKVIVAHLGAGASLAALQDGKSIATTMGFSAIEGIPMATRTGSIDPGVLLYLMREEQMDADALETLLYKQSGWLGVSGITANMQQLSGDPSPQAQHAIDLFCYRTAREIGSLCAALQGLDSIVFTGGIGENSPEIRARILAHCRWLGAEVDETANRLNQSVIQTSNSAINLYVIPTDEEKMLALHALATL